MLNGAQVPFDLDGSIALACLRAAWVATLMLAFGSVLFGAIIAPRATARMPADRAVPVASALGRLLLLALAASLLAGFGWLLLETANLAETSSLPATLSEMPTVLGDTRFGHLLGLQLASLVCTGLCSVRRLAAPRYRLALAPVTLAMLLQAGHGHAASTASAPFLLLAGGVHLLGAGAWLGGLPPLLVVVWTAPAKAAATAARYFSPLGQVCIAAILGSAAVQAWMLLGSIPALFGTAYGWMLLVKLSLLAVLLGFAAINRYRLGPALLRADPAPARRRLSSSLALQSAAGLAILLAAAVLASLPPGAHVQPVWPFTWQLSLETLREAPEFRTEAALAMLGVAASALLLLVCLWPGRRPRLALPGIAAAAALAWLAVPHLDLLVVSADATSFQTSPTGFTADTIAHGAELYPAHCAACHGANGSGDGPEARSLAVPPADLTASHLWAHRDGQLFWWLSHGIEAPQGGLSMPGFAGSLSDADLWDLIDAIRARNAGLVWRGTRLWSPPIAAPDLQAACADGTTATLADLRGHLVLLRIVRLGPARFDTSVTIPSDPGHIRCASDDQAVPLAYAIASGQTMEAMDGMRVVVDAAGWLRAFEPASVPQARLHAVIAQIAGHPLDASPPAHHLHHEA